MGILRKKKQSGSPVSVFHKLLNKEIYLNTDYMYLFCLGVKVKQSSLEIKLYCWCKVLGIQAQVQ